MLERATSVCEITSCVRKLFVQNGLRNMVDLSIDAEVVFMQTPEVVFVRPKGTGGRP